MTGTVLKEYSFFTAIWNSTMRNNNANCFWPVVILLSCVRFHFPIPDGVWRKVTRVLVEKPSASFLFLNQSSRDSYTVSFIR